MTRTLLLPNTNGTPVLLLDGTEALPGMRFQQDTNNGGYRAATDDWHLVVGGDTAIRFTTTAIVFNEDSADRDFRIESDGNTDVFMVDAGLDAVAFGTTPVGTRFFFVGGSWTQRSSTFSNAAGFNTALTTLSGSNEASQVSIDGSITTAAAANVYTYLAGLSVTEPGITLGASSSVTDAITLRIVSAPTEGTRNWFAVFGNPASSPAFGVTSAPNVLIGGNSVGTGTPTNALVITSGTAPTSSPTDTISLYSSDDTAGNTVPSFYCEGTGVLATGQADSASSVRVKMRVNGTVVTLLAI